MGKIVEYYNKYRKEGGDGTEKQLLTCRWQKIRPAVAKYVACVDQVKQRPKSGECKLDVTDEANQIYRSDMKEDFKFDFAWERLQPQPKFMNSFVYDCDYMTPLFIPPNYGTGNILVQSEESEGSEKRSKLDESGSFSSSSNLTTNTNYGKTLISTYRSETSKEEGKKIIK